MTKISNYSISVSWSDEDNMFVAVCPELDNLTALADSYEDAVYELKIAIDLVCEDMIASGEVLPQPQFHKTHSGQFRVRIPKSLHSKLAAQAKRERVSLNSLVTMYLSEASAKSGNLDYNNHQSSYIAEPNKP
jgi:predicted RNase H-like HicB family nuclease